MLFDVKQFVGYLWMAGGIVWLIGAFGVKQTARRQSCGSRQLQITLSIAAFMIGFSRYFRIAALTVPFVPDSPVTAYSGLAITAIGVAFAIWARFSLGGNWSGTVTVKENHSLVTKGPYSIVRHPIYTGLLLGLAGTAIVYREVRTLVALALVLVMLLLKIRIEERFMKEQFGAQYTDYRQRVKALIPLIY